MRKWDGLKEGEWVEMGREGRDAYRDRETYNTITLECVHLHVILQFEYKCSSNDLTIIKERCTYKRRNTKTNTKKHTCDLNVRIKRVQIPKRCQLFQRNKCSIVKHHQGDKEGRESPSMLKSTKAIRVTPATTA